MSEKMFVEMPAWKEFEFGSIYYRPTFADKVKAKLGLKNDITGDNFVGVVVGPGVKNNTLQVQIYGPIDNVKLDG